MRRLTSIDNVGSANVARLGHTLLVQLPVVTHVVENILKGEVFEEETVVSRPWTNGSTPHTVHTGHCPALDTQLLHHPDQSEVSVKNLNLSEVSLPDQLPLVLFIAALDTLQLQHEVRQTALLQLDVVDECL